jgi:hypothetical protein
MINPHNGQHISRERKKCRGNDKGPGSGQAVWFARINGGFTPWASFQKILPNRGNKLVTGLTEKTENSSISAPVQDSRPIQ